jgi:hypothetical protein
MMRDDAEATFYAIQSSLELAKKVVPFRQPVIDVGPSNRRGLVLRDRTLYVGDLIDLLGLHD